VKDPEENHTDAPGDAGWHAEVGRLEIVRPDHVRIWRDPFRRLHLAVEGGEEYVDVRPAPAFPISATADYISFLDGDGKEVLLLKNPDGLDPDSRSALEEELSRAYFVPRIVRVLEIEDSHGAARWEVETDRGYRVFDIRDREDMRVIGGRRLLLEDADGNRFEIEDLTQLDERSQRLVDNET
jgi:hypothetical protein